MILFYYTTSDQKENRIYILIKFSWEKQYEYRSILDIFILYYNIDMEQKLCESLNESINTLVLSFRDKYFKYNDEDKADIECIDRREDELSYNFQIWAYFFSLQDIYYAMWYDIPEKILFEWYDEAINEKIRINLKNFYLMNRKERKKAEN